MNKTIKIYIGILVLLFGGAILIEYSKPKAIDWRQTYNETHKIPYGTYVLFNELQSIVKSDSIETIRVTPYEYFDKYYNWQDSAYNTRGTYMLIDGVQNLDNVSAQELLDFASYGNNIFISTNYPPIKFLDTLKIEVQNDYSLSGKAKLKLANSIFKEDSITIEKGLNNIYFSKLDSVTTTVLGYQEFKNEERDRINFVKINHVNGNIYLHLQPAAFTNYQLLKDDHKKYAASVLSYLPDAPIFYDSRNKTSKDLGNSVMRYILKQPALKWAWFMALITMLVFMIFNAKRRQRIVQVIKPLTNTTVDFTRTIGNLYYETKDHNKLIDKKITYFLEHIRRVYYLDTQLLDDKFMHNLALKTGKDKVETKKLIDLVARLRAKQMCTEDDLLKLNKAIESFYTEK